MKDVLLFMGTDNKDHFKINYPYYGLFATAEVMNISTDAEIIFKCMLLNGNTVLLKKLLEPKKWIDVSLNQETPLSITIGTSIDDFLNN